MTIAEKIKEGVKEAIEKVEDIVEEVEEKAEDVAEKVEEKVEEFVEDVKEKLTGTSDASTSSNADAPQENLETEGRDLEKAAEKESDDNSKEAKDLEAKKKALLEKAAKLKGKLEETAPSTEDLKEQVKAKKKADMLIPLEEYVKAGIYLGTKVVTPDMKPFVYRRRADGLAIFNTDLIDEKLKEGIEFMSQFEAEDIVLVCKRQAGWKPARMFEELTGIRTFLKKYPAGILTNTDLPDFFENELTIVFDSWLDKNAFKDTKLVKKKVLMISDTNNFVRNADQVIIGNNKSPRSLGVIFYLLTKGYLKAKGIEKEIPDLEYWTGEKE